MSCLTCSFVIRQIVSAYTKSLTLLTNIQKNFTSKQKYNRSWIALDILISIIAWKYRIYYYFNWKTLVSDIYSDWSNIKASKTIWISSGSCERHSSTYYESILDHWCLHFKSYHWWISRRTLDIHDIMTLTKGNHSAMHIAPGRTYNELV